MSDENSAADRVAASEDTERSPMEKNLTSRDTWMRFLFMVISAVLISITGVVGTVVVWLGFLWVLFTGETNRQLQTVGQSIAAYVYQIVCYLTFNSDEKPFPLGGEWPSGERGV